MSFVFSFWDSNDMSGISYITVLQVFEPLVIFFFSNWFSVCGSDWERQDWQLFSFLAELLEEQAYTTDKRRNKANFYVPGMGLPNVLKSEAAQPRYESVLLHQLAFLAWVHRVGQLEPGGRRVQTTSQPVEVAERMHSNKRQESKHRNVEGMGQTENTCPDDKLPTQFKYY